MVKLIIIIYIFLNFWSCSNLYKTKPLATIIEIQGEVEVQNIVKTGRKNGFIGRQLSDYDILVLKPLSSCIIQIGDNACSVIKSGNVETAIKVQKLIDKKKGCVKTQIILNRGAIYTKVNKILKNGDSFSIITPKIVAAVRGTEFLIHHNESGDVTIAVNKGSVAVTSYIKTIETAFSSLVQDNLFLKERIEKIVDDNVIMVLSGKELSLNSDFMNAIQTKVQDSLSVLLTAKGEEITNILNAVDATLLELANQRANTHEISSNYEFELNELSNIPIYNARDLDALLTHKNTVEPFTDKNIFLKQAITNSLASDKSNSESKIFVEMSKSQVKAIQFNHNEANKAFIDFYVFPTNYTFKIIRGSSFLKQGKNTVTPGKYEIQISAKGYMQQIVNFEIENGKSITLNVVLVPFSIKEKITLLDDTLFEGAIINQNNETMELQTERGLKIIKKLDIKNIEYVQN